MYRERGGVGSKGKMERSSTATSSRAAAAATLTVNGKEPLIITKDRSSPANKTGPSRSSFPNKKPIKAVVGTGAQLALLVLLVILFTIIGMLSVGRGSIVTTFIVLGYKMPKMITKIDVRGNGIKTSIVNMVDVAKALARPNSYTTKYFGC